MTTERIHNLEEFRQYVAGTLNLSADQLAGLNNTELLNLLVKQAAEDAELAARMASEDASIILD